MVILEVTLNFPLDDKIRIALALLYTFIHICTARYLLEEENTYQEVIHRRELT